MSPLYIPFSSSLLSSPSKGWTWNGEFQEKNGWRNALVLPALGMGDPCPTAPYNDGQVVPKCCDEPVATRDEAKCRQELLAPKSSDGTNGTETPEGGRSLYIAVVGLATGKTGGKGAAEFTIRAGEVCNGVSRPVSLVPGRDFPAVVRLSLIHFSIITNIEYSNMILIILLGSYQSYYISLFFQVKLSDSSNLKCTSHFSPLPPLHTGVCEEDLYEAGPEDIGVRQCGHMETGELL